MSCTAEVIENTRSFNRDAILDVIYYFSRVPEIMTQSTENFYREKKPCSVGAHLAHHFGIDKSKDGQIDWSPERQGFLALAKAIGCRLVHLTVMLRKSGGPRELTYTDEWGNPFTIFKTMAEKYNSLPSLRGVDLQGAVLRETDLSHLDMTGAKLNEARLGHSALVGTILKGAELYRTSMVGVCAMEADFSDADLRSACFNRAILSRADMRGAKLRGCSMVDAVTTSLKVSNFLRYREEVKHFDHTKPDQLD